MHGLILLLSKLVMMQRMIKNQSAFSLIEIVVSLLVLSCGIVAISQLLLTSANSDRISEKRQKLAIMTRSIANSLSFNLSSEELTVKTQYWQQKVEQIAPGARLSIIREQDEGKWIYIIQIIVDQKTMHSLEVKLTV